MATTYQLCESICNYSAWTNEVRPVKLPPRIRLALGDVDAGSDTPSLVGKVLEWRRKRPEEGKFRRRQYGSRPGG
jgi:phosphomevalonate kinase